PQPAGACFGMTVERAGLGRLVRAASDVATGDAALFEVLLVIVLGAPKFRRRCDLRRDRAAEPSAGLELLLRRARGSLLLRSEVENRGTVLGADVRALT